MHSRPDRCSIVYIARSDRATAPAGQRGGQQPPSAVVAGILAAFALWWAAESTLGASLELRIADADSGQALAARVRIRDASGRDHVPAGGQVVRIGTKDRWFACDGSARLEVPAGRYGVRVERGTEYTPHQDEIAATDDAPAAHRVALRRWVNMRERGYVCGENHLHVSPAELGPQLVAEGLDFGTSLQWWNGPKFEVPPGGGFIRLLGFAGREVPASVYDFEIEHAWGAVYAVGVPAPVREESRPRRPNLPMVRAAHDAGALVAYQAGYSREALVDALLGYVDVINVISNNFQRHRFQPRSRYSNMLGVEGFPLYPDTAEGMIAMSQEWYYRLLNCGLRLAAGAESATGAKTSPVGYNRAYVRAGENPELPGFLTAWKAGRNFVTNGPMLFLRVNQRHEPGDTIELGEAGAELSVEARALADGTLTGLEIIVNGRTVPGEPALDGRRASLTVKAPVREGCWIAARCTERDPLLSDAELAAYDEKTAAQPTRVRFAHTSPLYVTVNGRGPRVKQSIDEARRVLDAFRRFAERESSPDGRDEIVAAVEDARKRLESAD